MQFVLDEKKNLTQFQAKAGCIPIPISFPLFFPIPPRSHFRTASGVSIR